MHLKLGIGARDRLLLYASAIDNRDPFAHTPCDLKDRNPGIIFSSLALGYLYKIAYPITILTN